MIGAIIAEYNPFHKGHLLHINKTLENTNCTDLICIMSGNFVQRGEPALFNKHIRCEMALKNGIDMVIELPVEYATSSADAFAFGAIDILNKSNIIDYLSFGSEIGNLNELKKITYLLSNENEEYKAILKMYSAVNSYATARSKAISKYLDINEDILKASNNILAIEYLTALNKTKSKIIPYTIQRYVNNYNQNELTGSISSATSIRNNILNEPELALNSIPANCHSYYNIKKIPTLDDYSDILKYILLNNSAEYLKNIADITEGLENRIYNNWSFNNISQLLDNIKTKRYTYSKLKRALLHIILNVKKEDQFKEIQYIRVLGYKKEKSYLLNKLINNSVVPVILNVKDNEKLLKKEIYSTDMYNICNNLPLGMEYKQPIIKI